MKDEYGFGRARLNRAKVIPVIYISQTEGEGTPQDVCRDVDYYYSLNGEFLAKSDPCELKGADHDED